MPGNRIPPDPRAGLPPEDFPAQCPDCGAKAPIQTSTGVVCRECGLVLGDQLMFESLSPEANRVHLRQSAVMRRWLYTKVGILGELERAPEAIQRGYRRKGDYLAYTLGKAYVEVRRVLGAVDQFSHGLVEACIEAFARAYARLPQKSPYRNVALLSLVAIYRVLQARGIAQSPDSLQNLLDASPITPEEFRTALGKTYLLFPPVDRRRETIALLRTLISRVRVPQAIAQLAIEIARAHLPLFPAAKSAVTAAAILTIAVQANSARDQFPAMLIAKEAGVAQSAVAHSVLAAYHHKGLPAAKPLDAAPAQVAAAFAPRPITTMDSEQSRTGSKTPRRRQEEKTKRG